MRTTPITILKLKWRPSRNGGRPWATPDATAQQLGAARRLIKNKDGGVEDLTVNLDLAGSLGIQPKEVIRSLMQVVAQHSQLPLVESIEATQNQAAAKWKWLAGEDPSLPPGRVRIFCEGLELVEALHLNIKGRAVQIGPDLVSIDLSNDLRETKFNPTLSSASQKNGRRGRGPRTSPPQ